jgi:hypothetical protein
MYIRRYVVLHNKTYLMKKELLLIELLNYQVASNVNYIEL